MNTKLTIEATESLRAEDAWTDCGSVDGSYSRESWMRDVIDLNTQRGYWEWVFAAIEADEEFTP